MQITQQTIIGNELCLVWSDGKESYLQLEPLRRACPCARCQGEPDALGRVVKPQVSYTPTSFQMRNITVVGGYALQPTWADGHNSGIYTFDLLRSF